MKERVGRLRLENTGLHDEIEELRDIKTHLRARRNGNKDRL